MKGGSTSKLMQTASLQARHLSTWQTPAPFFLHSSTTWLNSSNWGRISSLTLRRAMLICVEKSCKIDSLLGSFSVKIACMGVLLHSKNVHFRFTQELKFPIDVNVSMNVCQMISPGCSPIPAPTKRVQSPASMKTRTGWKTGKWMDVSINENSNYQKYPLR